MFLQIVLYGILAWSCISWATHRWLTRQNEETKLTVKNYKMLVQGGLPVVKVLALNDLDASDEEAQEVYNSIVRVYNIYRKTVMDDNELFRFSAAWPIYWFAYFYVKFGPGKQEIRDLNNEL